MFFNFFKVFFILVVFLINLWFFSYFIGFTYYKSITLKILVILLEDYILEGTNEKNKINFYFNYYL